jgi:hypothetical protein
MPRFRLDYRGDRTSLCVEADDFDDDGEQVTLFRYLQTDLDPAKEVVASFSRSLTGPPQSID